VGRRGGGSTICEAHASPGPENRTLEGFLHRTAAEVADRVVIPLIAVHARISSRL
jgi:hypothetical protein